MFVRRGPVAVAYFCLSLAIALVWLPSIGGCGAKCNSPSEPGNGSTTSKGSIEVTSVPTGAAVFLDGTNTGDTTDTVLTDVAAGLHVIRLVRTGFTVAPESILVQVEAERIGAAAFVLSLLDETGSIAVLSDPAGATILLDGLETGTVTPDTLAGIGVGPHAVMVDLAGYVSDPETVHVDVTADQVVLAEFTLSEPPPARLVYIEHFSNTACDPCVEVEENLELLLGQLGFDAVVSVGNHLYWPDNQDPFFLANSTELFDRGTQFGINYLPRVFIDGVLYAAPEAYDGFVAAVQAAGEIAPFFTIDVSTALQGDSVVANVTVKKLAATAEGDEALLVALVETGIEYDARNGLTHFDDILRKYLPGTTGRVLSLEVGESEGFRFAAAVSGRWNRDNIEAVAFIESRSTRKVYQTGSTR